MTTQCPVCESTDVVEYQNTEMIDYGTTEPVKLAVEMPLIKCKACNLICYDHRGEAAIEQAIGRYQRALSMPTAALAHELLGQCVAYHAALDEMFARHILRTTNDKHAFLPTRSRPWAATKTGHMLIERARAALMEAGGGIEPPTTGA